MQFRFTILSEGVTVPSVMSSLCWVSILKDREERKKDFLSWLGFLCLYLCIYGLLLFRFGMDYDEVREYGVPVTDNYIALGRWGLYVYRWVMGGGSVPGLSGLVAGFLISAALVLQVRFLGLTRWWQRFVYGGMYLGVMQWAFQLRYSMQSDAVGLSFFCTSLAAWVLFWCASPWRRCLISSLLLCYGLSIYQSSVLYFLILILAKYVAMIQDARPMRLKHVLLVLLALLGGGGLYYAIHAAFLAFFPLSDYARAFGDAYLAMQSGGIPAGTGLVEVGKILLHYSLRVPFSQYVELEYPGRWVVWFSLPVALLVIYSLIKHGRSKMWWVMGSLLTVAIVWVPYSLSLMLLHGYFPIRVYVAESVSVACLWALLIRRFPCCGRVQCRDGAKLLCCIIASFVAFKAMYWGALMARDETYYHARSMEELISMNARGQQVALREGLNDCPIVVLGAVHHPGEQMYSLEKEGRFMNEVSPYVFFWDGCLQEYARFLRLPRLKRANDKDCQLHRGALEEMPTWPADGSVRADKGEVIIRVGEITPALEASGRSPAR